MIFSKFSDACVYDTRDEVCANSLDCDGCYDDVSDNYCDVDEVT
jgi:hypothetical protein